MRAEYSYIFEAYFQNEHDMDSILYMDIAVEADQQNGTAEVGTVNGEENTKKLNIVSKLVQKITDIIGQFIQKVSSRLKLFLETDKGFTDKYLKQKSIAKPLQNVKVMSYTYNANVLNQIMTKITADISHALTSLATYAQTGAQNFSARDREILGEGAKLNYAGLFGAYTKDPNVTSPADFVKWTITKFRGEKKNIMYNVSQIATIEQLARNSKELRVLSSDHITKARLLLNRIKAFTDRAKRLARAQGIGKEGIQQLLDNVNKATKLFNIYASICNAYYEMQLEMTLNYRVILKKFYQM